MNEETIEVNVLGESPAAEAETKAKSNVAVEEPGANPALVLSPLAYITDILRESVAEAQTLAVRGRVIRGR